MKTTASIRPLRTMDDVIALEAIAYDELVPARSLYEVFEATAALHGDRPALTVLATADPHDVAGVWTHRELLREITRAANLFASLGISGEDVIGIVSKTYAQIPSLIWGAETAGVVSCLNYMLTGDILAELLRAEQCRVLVCPGPRADAELWHKLRTVVDQVPTIRTVLVIGGCDERDPRFVSLDGALAAHDGDALTHPRRIDRNTLAALFHTGGTTGVPKLVPHTHGNQIHAAWSFAQSFEITAFDVGMNGLPMFHVGGTSTWGMSVLGAGGHVVVMGPLGYRDPAMVRHVWAIAAHFRATMTGSVPTTIGAMGDIPVGDCDISSLRMAQTGGAVLSATVAERFEQRAGIPLLEQYGMTESVAAIAATPFAGAHVRGSVGLRCPFSEVQVWTQEDGEGARREAAPDEIGLVVCRGPQIVSGYVDPRHTQGGFTHDGWLITGDLGYLTPKGWLVLTGREKDLIIRGGHNIDPAAIEEVALAFPGMSACAAVGMPDGYAGEVPVLFAVPLPGTQLDVDALQVFLQRRIHEPPAKPRHVFVVDALPTTEVGKIFKPALRRQALLEKLRFELSAAGADARIEDMQVDTGTRPTSVVIVTLAGADGVLDSAMQAAITRGFLSRVTDLPFEFDVRWAGGHPST